jgi:hypothetical protein
VQEVQALRAVQAFRQCKKCRHSGQCRHAGSTGGEGTAGSAGIQAVQEVKTQRAVRHSGSAGGEVTAGSACSAGSVYEYVPVQACVAGGAGSKGNTSILGGARSAFG